MAADFLRAPEFNWSRLKTAEIVTAKKRQQTDTDGARITVSLRQVDRILPDTSVLPESAIAANSVAL